VKRLSNVTFLYGKVVLGLVVSGTDGTCTGVRVRANDSTEEEVMSADLIVEATGRTGNKIEEWLQAVGFGPVPLDEVRLHPWSITWSVPLLMSPLLDCVFSQCDPSIGYMTALVRPQGDPAATLGAGVLACISSR
jgi:hypothetical protein